MIGAEAGRRKTEGGPEAPRPFATLYRLSPSARFSYVALSTLLFGFLLLRTQAQPWVSDFWEHAAVVRELATNPLGPRHPQLALEAPHAFFSPYSLAVGLLARLTGLDAIAALSLVGLFNLALLLFGLYQLVRTFSPWPAAPVYALLFCLFLWGPGAWPYSGFFHLRGLAWNIPYPSTFAAGLACLGLAAAGRYLKRGERAWLLALLVLTPVLLLSHPITFAFFGTGLLALGLGGDGPTGRRRAGLLLVAVGLGAGLALAWPYYSVWALLTEAGPLLTANEGMYDGVLERVFPALLALPVVVWRLRARRRDPLALLLLGLVGIYLLGGLTGRYSYGRLISFAVLAAQIALADGLAAAVGARRLKPRLAAIGALALALVALFDQRQLLARSLPGRASSYGEYLFLRDTVPQYEVVLTDVKSGLLVPPFGGKVVASPHALAFVPDHDARREAVRRFLSDEATAAERAEIIARYRVQWLLLDGSNDSVSAGTVAALRRLGTVAYSDPVNKLTLIKLRP